MDFKKSDITLILGISRATLYRRMAETRIEKYSDMSDGELDQLIREIKESHPNDGEIMV